MNNERLVRKRNIEEWDWIKIKICLILNPRFKVLMNDTKIEIWQSFLMTMVMICIIIEVF